MMTSPLARHFARCLAHNLLACLALTVFVIFTLASAEKESISRPAADGSAVAVVEAHGCTGQDNPTHAVITIDGQTRYVGQRLTDKAIEQAVFGIDHGLIVHAFCA